LVEIRRCSSATSNYRRLHIHIDATYNLVESQTISEFRMTG